MTCLNAQSDLTIHYKQETRAFLVLSSSYTFVEYHSGKYKRINNKKKQFDIIYDYNDFIQYTILHKERIIRKIALNDVIKVQEMRAQLGIDKANANDREYHDIGDTGNIIVKEDGMEIINKRKCVRYTISMGNFLITISFDPNLVQPIIQDYKVKMLHDITDLTDPGRYKNNYTLAETTVSENEINQNTFRKIDELLSHIPLKKIMKFNLALSSSLTATKVVEGPIPATVFALPDGYVLEDGGKKLLEQFHESKNLIPPNIVVGEKK